LPIPGRRCRKDSPLFFENLHQPANREDNWILAGVLFQAVQRAGLERLAYLHKICHPVCNEASYHEPNSLRTVPLNYPGSNALLFVFRREESTLHEQDLNDRRSATLQD
jgi:hypothetical protein